MLVPSVCEDCDARLVSCDGGDDMAVDNFATETTACVSCGKHVCFSCSVSNLGEERRCLQCAGSNVGVGVGIGVVGMPIC